MKAILGTMLTANPQQFNIARRNTALLQATIRDLYADLLNALDGPANVS